MVSPSAFAASHTWSGAVNGFFSNAGNWSSGGVPTLAETNSLTFPSSATRFTVTNDIGALTVSAMTFSGSNYIVRGASTITFAFSLINVLCSGNSNTIESTLNLPFTFAVTVADNKVMAFHTLTGAGSLIKFGEGAVHLRGSANNTLSGGYTVNVGALELLKTGGATAIAGPLAIVGTTNFGEQASVRLNGSEQIAGNVNVVIHPTGILSVNGHTNTLNNLTVMSGTAWLGGLLRLNGNLILSATDNPFPTPDVAPLIQTDFEFIGASSTITVSNLTCGIDGSIVEFGTPTILNKTGPGALSLNGPANNFTGALNINQGRVIAASSSALGTLAGATTVANGAVLVVSPGVNSSEALTLTGLGDNGQGALQLTSGTATLSGVISLTGETGIGAAAVGAILNLDGPINGGGGIRKLGAGTVSLNGFGNNTFSGASFVANGQLTLNKSANVRAISSVTVTNGASLVFNANELMDDAGVLSIYHAAVVNLTNRNETIGGLNTGGVRTLDTGTGTLTLKGDVFVGPPYGDGIEEVTIQGLLSLGGATRNITISNFGILRFDCNISDGAGTGGLNQKGGNTELMRSNSFTGPVTLYGTCRVFNNASFGAPGGGVNLVSNALSSLNIIYLHPSVAISGETLTVSSTANYIWPVATNAWNGPIVFTNGAELTCDGNLSSDFTLGGMISGSNTFLACSDGITRLLGTNTYTGTTLVIADGTLVVGNPQALGSSAAGTEVWENSTLALDLPNGGVVTNEALTLKADAFTINTNASLLLPGSVSNTWSGPITILGDPSRVEVRNANGTLNLNAAIVGSGTLEKTGPGKLILAGSAANTYTGETIVTDGTLRLQKANGVQATTNLTVNRPGRVEWGGSEQIADGATLSFYNELFSLAETNAYVASHGETITHLVVTNGGTTISGTSGVLTLLGNINVAGGTATLDVTIALSPGTHQVTGLPFGLGSGSLIARKSIHETGGSGGLTFLEGHATLAGSNSFSGPVIVDKATLAVAHPHALGSPASGTLLTNSGLIDLIMPSGSVLAGESLVLAPPAPGAVYPSTVYMSAEYTNTWAGPISLLGSNQFSITGGSKLTVDGTVSGPGPLNVDYAWDLVLTGTQPNSCGDLIVKYGTVRLAKPAGVPAFVGNLIQGDAGGPATVTVILESPGQFLPQATATVGIGGTGSILDLNGHAATIRKLSGFGTVQIGTGTLTISNSVAELAQFLGAIHGAPGGLNLVQQGIGQQRVGNFDLQGAMAVQGGSVLMDNGSIGALDISSGALMDMYASVANFGSLSGAGNIYTAGNGLINVGGNNVHSTYSGVIYGGSQTNIVKIGLGALTLTGASTDPGKTVVNAGSLIVNGSLAGPVQVNAGGTLRGTGSLQAVTASGTSARIAPGSSLASPSYGIMKMASLTLNANAILSSEISGTNAGVNLDQLEVTNSIALAGGQLELLPSGYGVLSNRFTLIKATGAGSTSGNFTGLAEGGSTFSGGRGYQITYLGATSGRDVVLTQTFVPLEPSVTGLSMLTNGAFSLNATGTPSVQYALEFRNDMAAGMWLPFTNLTAHPGTGALNLIDLAAPVLPKRFYRFNLP